jgi:hypothetical protein
VTTVAVGRDVTFAAVHSINDDTEVAARVVKSLASAKDKVPTMPRNVPYQCGTWRRRCSELRGGDGGWVCGW